jgi:hypothetical protein
MTCCVGFDPTELCECCEEYNQYRNGLCWNCWIDGQERRGEERHDRRVIERQEDIGGYEADCGDSKPKAEIVSDSGHYCVMVGNNCIARYDQQSDDYAYTHARKAAEKWNAEA